MPIAMRTAFHDLAAGLASHAGPEPREGLDHAVAVQGVLHPSDDVIGLGEAEIRQVPGVVEHQVNGAGPPARHSARGSRRPPGTASCHPSGVRVRCNPNKQLPDPYMKALSGHVNWDPRDA